MKSFVRLRSMAFEPFLILALSVLFTGCASVGGRGSQQLIFVDSNPEGLSILVNGKNQGTTPDFVLIERKRKTHLTLMHPKTKNHVEVDVPTSYRWGRSFLGNLILFTLAPVGWIGDLSTGAAWHIHDVTEYDATHLGPPPAQRKLRIAIAPPLAPSSEISDLAAESVFEQLQKKFPADEVLPYRSTLAAFYHKDYDFDSRSSDPDYRELFFESRADAIFESSVSPGFDASEVAGYLRDSTNNRLMAEKLVFNSPGVENQVGRKITNWLGGSTKLFYLLPTTVSIDATTRRMSLDVTDFDPTVSSPRQGTYEPTEDSSGPFLTRAFNYINRVNLSFTRRPRSDSLSKFTFLFVPSLSVARQNYKFPGLARVANYSFAYENYQLGYGPEVGIQFGQNYIYLHFVPGLALTRLHWSQEPHAKSEQDLTVFTETEVGYQRFFYKQFMVRLFNRSTTGQSKVWQNAFSTAAGHPVSVSDTRSFVTGLMLGFHFL